MAGLKDSRLQHLTATISSLLGLVACVLTGVDILTRTTGWEGVATICDLKWQLSRILIFMQLNLFNRLAYVRQFNLISFIYLVHCYIFNLLSTVLPSSCCQSQILMGWFFRWASGGHPGGNCWSFHRGHRSGLYRSLAHSLPGMNGHSTAPKGEPVHA